MSYKWRKWLQFYKTNPFCKFAHLHEYHTKAANHEMIYVLSNHIHVQSQCTCSFIHSIKCFDSITTMAIWHLSRYKWQFTIFTLVMIHMNDESTEMIVDAPFSID